MIALWRFLIIQLARQREYFLAGQTRPAAWRRSQLEAVKALFTENHDELCDALWKDLRRNVIDADLIDVTYCAKEADYALQHLVDWMEPQRAPTPLVFQPGRIRVRRDPLGVTLAASRTPGTFAPRRTTSSYGLRSRRSSCAT